MGVQDPPVGLLPFDHETITVADAAIGLTAATYLDATRAEITLETAQIRFWDDGTAPTTTVGRIVNIGDEIILNTAAQVTGFKAIRTSASSGKLMVQYFH